jgi:hypothetical protein
MWSKIKSCLKKLTARCDDTFKEGIKVAFTAVKKLIYLDGIHIGGI